MYKFRFIFSILIVTLILQSAIAQENNIHAPNALHDDRMEALSFFSKLKDFVETQENPGSLPKRDVPILKSDAPPKFVHVIKRAFRASARKRKPGGISKLQANHPQDIQAADDPAGLLSGIQSISPQLSRQSDLTGDGPPLSFPKSNVQSNDLASFIMHDIQGNSLQNDIQGNTLPVYSLQSDALSVKPVATGQQASPHDASIPSFTNFLTDSIVPYIIHPSIQIPDALSVPQTNVQPSIPQIGVSAPASQAFQPDTVLSSSGTPRPVIYPIADPLPAQPAANSPAKPASDSSVTAFGNLPENAPLAPAAAASPLLQSALPSPTSPELPTAQPAPNSNHGPSNTILTPAPSSAVITSISITESAITNTRSMTTTTSTSTTRLTTTTAIPSMSNGSSDQIKLDELSFSLFILISLVFW